MEPSRYVAGGTVQAEGGIYLERAADRVLLDLCNAGAFAYILSSRQIGKSSLMIRAMEMLQAIATKTVFLDLTEYGVLVEPRQWYKGILSEIASQLGLSISVSTWWEQNAYLSVTQRFNQFLIDSVLAHVKEKVVIFVDEIDTTINLRFTDDFFAAIRYLYNLRARKPDLKRLSFVLAGVATPSQLIQDPTRTPFNIGSLVELADFSLNEALPLIAGLAVNAQVPPRDILVSVLGWTGGHPYLTLRVFRELQQRPPEKRLAVEVDRLVRELFFDLGPEDEKNLQFVRETLLRSPLKDKVITEYLTIRGGATVTDREADPVKTWLKLSGIVRREGGLLRVRNRIYETVFTEEWARQQLPIWTGRRAERSLAANVYISYSRRDGADLAKRLREDLVSIGVQVWLDDTVISPDAIWSTAVEAAIDRANVLLAVLTSGSFESAICRAEQLRALRKGKVVIPILAQRDAPLPLHLETKQFWNFTGDSSYVQAFSRLVTAIEDREGASLLPQFRSTYVTVPPLPSFYIERRDAVTRLRDLLLKDNLGRAIAITALTGMGGIGKTILAQALANDEVVQQAFPDGVIWSSAGREPSGQLTTRMRDVLKWLGDDPAETESEARLTSRYRSLMRNRAALLVVDDVWRLVDVEPFLTESPRSRLLLTTRDASIARSLGSQEFVTGLLTEVESLMLLALWADLNVSVLPSQARDLSQEAGRLPLALSMIGAMLRGQPRSSWDRVLVQLRRADLERIGAQFPAYPYRDLLRAIEVSVDMLDAVIRQRYLSLAVLLEDMPAELAIQQTLWKVDKEEALETAERMVSLSLAHRDGRGGIRLHALQLDYVRARFPDQRALETIHGAIRLSSHVIDRDPRQFASQIVGRLLSHLDNPAIRLFTETLAVGAPTPWLQLLRPTLAPPGTALIRTLEGHSASTNGVAVTPDGQRMISAHADGTLKVWDVATGRELTTIVSRASSANAVAISPDGLRAVSAHESGALKEWDLGTGREIREMQNDASSIDAVALTSDGRRAITGSENQALAVWDLEKAQVVRTLEGHSAAVNGVAVTPDGRLVASACSDHTVKVWDLETGCALLTYTGHSSAVNCVALSPDGRLAVSASSDKTLKVWELQTGRTLRDLTSHSEAVNAVAISPDGLRGISASSDNLLKVWDLESGRELRTLSGHAFSVTAVAITPDGRWAISASDDETLKIWDLNADHQLRSLEGHYSSVNVVASVPGGRWGVSGSSDQTLKVWDLGTSKELRTLEGHSGWVIGGVVTPDGRSAISTSSDRTVTLWDLVSGRAIRTLKGHSSVVTAVAVSSDGRVLVSASADKSLSVSDLGTGVERLVLRGHSSSVTGVALTFDGRRAISASWDTTIKVWDVKGGRELYTLTGHSLAVTKVAISPDGQRAISASMDQTLKVWDLQSGVLLRSLAGHASGVNDVAVSPDGRLAVSASSDKTLKVWDLEAGAAIATFTCDADALSCVFIENQKVMAGDALGRVHFLLLVSYRH